MVKFPEEKIAPFSQMHFHLSSKNDEYSEHTINGNDFAMEVI